MSWELYHVSDNGDELIASHRAESDSTESIDVVCLEDGYYYFLLLDSWGDGSDGGTLSSEPAVTGLVEDVTLDDGEYGYHNFELGDTGCQVIIEGCGDDDAVNYIQGVTVDDGSCTFCGLGTIGCQWANDDSGIHLLRT